jgi:hypothetical protein
LVSFCFQSVIAGSLGLKGLDMDHRIEVTGVDSAEQLEAEGPGGVWFVRLEAEQMTIARADGTRSHKLTKSETATKLEWHGLTEDAPHFVAHVPKPLALRMGQRDASRLLGWLGPPPAANMTTVLRRQFKWSFGIAVLWIAGSLPIRGDDATGLEPTSFDAVAAALGAILVIQGILVRWRPHRFQFLLNAGWLAMAALWCLSNAFNARDLLPLAFWFVMTGALIGLAVQAVKLFFHFEHTV